MDIMNYFILGLIGNFFGLLLMIISTIYIMIKIGKIEVYKLGIDIKLLKECTKTNFLYKLTVLSTYLIPFYHLYMSIIYIILIIKNKKQSSFDIINILIKYEKFQIYRSFKETPDVRKYR